MKVVHLSDLHLTRNGAPLYGRAPLTRLEQAVDLVLAADADAELPASPLAQEKAPGAIFSPLYFEGGTLRPFRRTLFRRRKST